MAGVKNIAVIGAGMAGLACGDALQQAGYLVTIFEKSRGPSGRASTRTGEGWQCDHGAQYFTVSDERFAAQVRKWQQAGVVAEWQGRIFETDGVQLTAKQADKVRYVGVPKNTAPARFLAGALEVELQHTVERIHLASGQWHVQTKEHGPYQDSFDQLVLAIPSAQAEVLLAGVSDACQQLAASVRMHGCWALMGRYAQPLALPFDGLFVNAGPLSWVARDSSKPGRARMDAAVPEVWLLHASPDWSEAHLEREDAAVAQEMIAAFVALGGQVPEAYSIHRWRYADSAQPLQQGFAWDSQLQLGLCGDWLNGGKVEGAWLSGHRLSQRLIDHDMV